MTFSWADVKDEIEKLYMKEGKSLDEVRDILKESRNFNPSVRAYKDKFDEWGYKKYNRRRREPTTQSRDLVRDLDLVQTTEMALALLANSESEAVTVNLVQVEQELELLASDAREQQIVLSKASRKRRREDAETDIDEVKHSIQRVAKLEASLTQTRKTLQRVMTSIRVQTCGPIGFASCWKQEPMTLEDAHGKLLPLPLELVVSWEMFDNILLTHFRTLAGEVKVQKGEFEIEDSISRSTLRRTSPWSEICKPGRKIDMSMIFKDVGKTSVVCPKCDTISKEENGVQVECSNPDCKMIFRTEDDEDAVEASTGGVGRPTLLAMGKQLFPDLVGPSHRDEIEDRPGMFKRVIIRLLRIGVGRQSSLPSWQSFQADGQNTDEEKDPFLTLLEQLAESEYSRDGQAELDFFLNGGLESGVPSAPIPSLDPTGIYELMDTGASDVGLSMIPDSLLIPQYVPGFNNFGGDIDGYRLSAASSYIGLPQAQMLAAGNVEDLDIDAFLNGVHRLNSYAVTHGHPNSRHLHTTQTTQSSAPWEETTLQLLSAEDENDSFWMNNFAPNKSNNGRSEVIEENVWAQ